MWNYFPILGVLSTFLITQVTCEAEAGVAYIQISESSLRDSANCSLPSEISFKLKVGNKQLDLKVTKNPDIHSDVPVYGTRTEEGKIFFVQEKLDNEVLSSQYQGVEQNAAVTVSCLIRSESNVRLTVEGLLTIDGQEYTLEPQSRHRRDAHHQHEEAYTLVKTELPAEINDYREIPGGVEETDNLVELKNVHNERPKRETSEYFIDVFLLVDFIIYKRFYDRSTQPTIQTKRIDALQKTRQYFATVMNGVNLRYKGIKGLNSLLTIRLIGLYIAETSTSAPWVENFRRVSAIGNEVNADKVLEYLRSWVSRATSLPSADHVMLFTGYDAYSVIGGEKTFLTTGLAYISTMCMGDGRSVSVVEDRGGFQSTDTATHELGHSLGARHDGTNNSCLASDRYIMSGGSYKQTPLNKYHPWLFSTCSVNQFQTYLTSLMRTTQGVKCLTEKLTAVSVPDVSDQLPGQMYSANEQCRLIYGTGSHLCLGPEFMNRTDICASMFCLDPKTERKCYMYETTTGTSCGDKMWCQLGKCVYSVNAAPNDPRCPHGDQEGITFSGKTCKDFLIGDSSAYCYQPLVRMRCCKSCAKHLTGAPACLYGDKQLGCDKQFCGRQFTDGTLYSEKCCGTCGQATTTPTPSRACVNFHGITFNELTCTEYVVQTPEVCYSDSVRRYCCRACKEFGVQIKTPKPTTLPPLMTTTAVKKHTTSPSGVCINYADSRGIKFNGLTCTDYVAEIPEVCYLDAVQFQCCKACREHSTGVLGTTTTIPTTTQLTTTTAVTAMPTTTASSTTTPTSPGEITTSRILTTLISTTSATTSIPTTRKITTTSGTTATTTSMTTTTRTPSTTSSTILTSTSMPTTTEDFSTTSSSTLTITSMTTTTRTPSTTSSTILTSTSMPTTTENSSTTPTASTPPNALRTTVHSPTNTPSTKSPSGTPSKPSSTISGSCIDGKGINGSKCSQYIADWGKSTCYVGNIAKACCLSCSAVKDAVPGCEYGDREPSVCSAAKSVVNGCSGLENTCCKTCKTVSVGGGSGHSSPFKISSVILLIVTIIISIL